jgi:hypothetical protein
LESPAATVTQTPLARSVAIVLARFGNSLGPLGIRQKVMAKLRGTNLGKALGRKINRLTSPELYRGKNADGAAKRRPILVFD